MSDFPYPGLRPFHRHETDIFFGRETATDQLIEKLGPTRFLAVVGPSGCGKSSLVRTGLLAGLETGFLATAGVHWRIAELRPGNHPFARLAEALLVDKAIGPEYRSPFAESAQAIAFLHAQLRRGPLSLVEVLRETTLPEPSNLLLVVDQFEEIFRYYYQGAANEAAAFVALLLTSSQLATQPMPVYVVITMRSDFIGDCALFYDLPEAINQGLFLTPRLTREQLREAIEAPANVFDSEIEAVLINRLLNDAGNDPDQLPLLQHALMRMWHLAQAENVATIILTTQHYEAIGGLAEALSRHADEAYAELNPLEQKIAEILFCSLTDRSKGLQYTRRPVSLETVALQANVSWQQVAQVVEIFRQPGRNFLTPIIGTPLTPESILDISHESLIRQWQRLNQWTKTEAESAELYQRLEDSACRWQEKRAELWSGIELEIALTWRQQHQPTANWAKRYGETDGKYFDLATQFLDRSKAKQQEELQQAELARQRQVQQELHQAKLREKVLLAGRTATWALLGLIVAVTLALWGYWERNKALLAEQQAAHSESARTHGLFELQLTHAALLARDEDYAAAKTILKATRELDNLIPTNRRYARNLVAWFCELRGEAPQKIYEGAGAQLLTTAISSDGKMVAAAGEKGTLVLFEVSTGKILQYLQQHSKKVTAVLFYPQQPWLISAGEDQRIIIWSLTTGKPILEWQAPYQINALALSPEGAQLASAGNDNDIILWDPKTGQRLKTFQAIEGENVAINDLTFDPQGKWLVSAASDNTATLWNLAESKKIRTFVGHTGEIQDVAFNPQGDLLATSSDDRSIRLWEVATGETLRVLRGHQNTVYRASFIDNGHYVVSASQDRTLRIWDTDSGTSLRVLQGHTAGVTGLTTWEKSIFSSGFDGKIMRWQAALPYQTTVKLVHEPASIAIAPDGKHIAVGLANGTLQWYSLPEIQLHWENKQAHAKDIQRLSFNALGNLLASASFDNTAKLWQVSPEQLTEQQVFEGHQDAIEALAFSPDSRILATASYDSQFGLFTIGSDQKRFHKAHDGVIHSVNFDLSGTHLLTAGKDGYTRLWNIAQDPPVLLQTFPKEEIMWASFKLWQVSPAQLTEQQVFEGYQDAIEALAFSPDSRILATASYDNQFGLFTIGSDQKRFHQAHDGQTVSVNFARSGTRLLTAGEEGYTRLWNIAQDPLVLLTFPKTQEEIMWANFSPDNQQVATVERDWLAQVYSVKDNQLRHRLIGHEQTIFRANFTPDAQQMVTVSGDATVRFWDLSNDSELFTLSLPNSSAPGEVPLWDFDFRCIGQDCWIAVPLTQGKLVLYQLKAIYK